MDSSLSFTAFLGTEKIASGDLAALLSGVKPFFDRDAGASLLIFEDRTGRQVDFDLRGSVAEVLARALPATPRTGPGRPKLGVVAREISLLPRHWEWLEGQPSGASAALRQRVDEARSKDEGAGRARAAREAASRFLTAMAGNLPGYEEATRALFAGDGERFAAGMREWPGDIREFALRLTAEVLIGEDSSSHQRT